jgi:hypothetical protein
VTDYDALARKLKGKPKAGEPRGEKQANYGFAPATFYQYVKQQIEEEVDKANGELRKRDLPIVERVFVPSFEGKISLTFATGFLCTVELNEQRGRIRAVIFGPPNRDEIARKDYFLSPDGFSPHRIAAEIVSGLLEGEFV